MNRMDIALAAGGKFSGYFAAPDGKPRASLVVVQEIYGVNREVRRVADHYAAAGFAVLAPDLLWRAKPGLEIDYADRETARKVVGSLDQGAIASDLADAYRALRTKGGNGKLGVVALGWGGKFAYAAAGQAGVDAIVSYYPGNLPGSVALTKAVAAPQMFHFARHDERTKPEFRTELRTALADRDDVEIYVYPDADHGFANVDRTEYHRDSARLADERTAGFLHRTLAAGA